jgi:hypothetical protein
VARRIHGIDEAVELDSIVRGAKTLALFLARHAAGVHDGAAREALGAGRRG